MTAVYEEPKELAQAIRDARVAAGMGQQELADELGTSIGTVKRWEGGEIATLGKTPNARRAVAAQVAEVTGYARELLGLPARHGGSRSIEQRVGVLELQMRTVLDSFESGEPLELAELREAAAGVAQRYDPSSETREEPGSAAANE